MPWYPLPLLHIHRAPTYSKRIDKISAKVGVHSIPSAIPTVGRGSIHYDLAGIPAGLYVKIASFYQAYFNELFSMRTG